jgi:glycosyltransferase involved in cell wall biosynthesis
MGEPLLSVIIPVWNGEQYLAEAVTSVLEQGYTPVEIIVVDDGSTDRTAKIAADFKDSVKYVYQSNQGPAAARNKGLEIARGDVIGFLDADDQWQKKSLTNMLECMNQSPETEIVMGKIRLWRLKEDKSEEFSEPGIAFCNGCALFRKEVFYKVGLFDPALRYGEDLDWFMRARDRNVSIVVLDQVFLLYRRHQSNMTRGTDPITLNVTKVLKKSLDRRRSQSERLAHSLRDIPQALGLENFDQIKPKNSE